MGTVRSFEELECWKQAVILRQQIMEIIKKFPQDEKYRLTDQIVRCARSVTNNIAEGYGRFHYKENAKFCRDSRGSLMELLDHFIIAREINFVTDEELESLRAQINRSVALLNGYINYLLRAKQGSDDNAPDNK